MIDESNSTTMPLQPVYRDARGTLRFKENTIVRYLLENGGVDLNTLSQLSFRKEDWEQFARRERASQELKDLGFRPRGDDPSDKHRALVAESLGQYQDRVRGDT